MYCCSCLVCVVILCVFVVLCGHCFFFSLDAGLLARSQYSEGPATGRVELYLYPHSGTYGVYRIIIKKRN